MTIGGISLLSAIAIVIVVYSVSSDNLLNSNNMNQTDLQTQFIRNVATNYTCQLMYTKYSWDRGRWSLSVRFKNTHAGLRFNTVCRPRRIGRLRAQGTPRLQFFPRETRGSDTVIFKLVRLADSLLKCDLNLNARRCNMHCTVSPS
ncbi:hypothetical protein F5Y03DRAFT_26846 [Xylaria venustula]|nr:hypothetical protein F5Y03DRAFT_26846 [Xylaria venustula]